MVESACRLWMGLAPAEMAVGGWRVLSALRMFAGSVAEAWANVRPKSGPGSGAARYSGHKADWADCSSNQGAQMSTPEQPKLIIDSDWKSQAQAEKERLTQKAETTKAQQQEREEVRFTDLVSMFATQALSYMGFIPDPQTGQAMVSLEYAKLYIDMLGVLEAKTKNNLTEEENTLLTKTVAELRGAFVETSQLVAKAVKEGRLRPAGGGMGGAGAGAGPASGGMSPLVMPDSGG